MWPGRRRETIKAHRQFTQDPRESPLMVIGLMVFAIAVPIVAIQALVIVSEFLPEWAVIVAALASPLLPQLFFAVSAIWRLRENGVNWRELMLGTRRPAEAIFYGILLGIGLVTVQLLIARLISSVAIWAEKWLGIDLIGVASQEQYRAFDKIGAAESTLLLAYFVLLVAVVAPITEELFFRGYAYTTFRSHWGVRTAALASAFVFAIIHLYFVLFLTVFAMGILFAIFYERSRSLLSMMVAHFVVNLTVTYYSYLPLLNPELIA